jgi:hypothetical protein
MAPFPRRRLRRRGPGPPALGDFSAAHLIVTAGAGARWAVRPDEGINIRLDAGFGTDGPQIYFDVLEVF